MANENARLHARVEELEAALAPFARTDVPAYCEDRDPLAIQAVAGDLRRAAHVLSPALHNKEQKP